MFRKVLPVFLGAAYAMTNEEFLVEKDGEADDPTTTGVYKQLVNGVDMYFKVLKQGNVKAGRPRVNTACLCHYRGKLAINPKGDFDSSWGRGEPTQFAPNQVIKGWTHIMQDMYIGERRQMWLHPDIAYGARGSPPKIPENAILEFEMEIKDCDPSALNTEPREKDYPTAPDAKDVNDKLREDFPRAADDIWDDGQGPDLGKNDEFLAKKAKEADVHVMEKVTTPSGDPQDLLFKVLKQGDASKGRPQKDTPCKCHYRGRLALDGKEFDSSYSRNDPTTFAPGQVIPGWTNIMQDMYIGERRQMWLHHDLGYGSRAIPNVIPAYSVLQFEMEILDCAPEKGDGPASAPLNMEPRAKDYATAADAAEVNEEMRMAFPSMKDAILDDGDEGAAPKEDL